MILFKFCNPSTDKQIIVFLSIFQCLLGQSAFMVKEGNVAESNLSFIDIKYGNFEEDGKKVS